MKSISGKITISFVMTDLIDKPTLTKEYGGSLKAFVEMLIKEEGLCGLIDDDITLESVEEIPQIKPPRPCNICDGHGTYFQGEREIACFGCDDKGNPKIIEVVHKKKVVFRGLSNHIDVKKAIAENYLIRAAKEVKDNAI